MQYIFPITIPPNTLKSNPESLVCKLTQGTIVKVSVGFPPGPKGLAHLVICRFEHQAWPTNPDGDFAWDNHVMEFSTECILSTFPYTLKLYGWNEDDTYEHTITVGFNVSRGAYDIERLFHMTMPVTVEEGEF